MFLTLHQEFTFLHWWIKRILKHKKSSRNNFTKMKQSIQIIATAVGLLIFQRKETDSKPQIIDENA